jgi:ferredoxin-nitrate reductase
VFGAFWCELVSCANILQYRFVYSTCNICSNGCGCYIAVKDDKIVGIMGNEHYPVNRGRLGPKGENQWWANNSVDRLKTPLNPA